MRRDKEAPPKKRAPAYYWWTLANVLALCLAVVSWLMCLHIFKHPEIPRNYEILRKLGRTEPPRPLTELEAPPGEAADPRALYRRYAALAGEDLLRFNAALMRNYLFNLREPKLIQYAEGDYRVQSVRRLGPGDLFHPGFAVRARAMVAPDEFSEPAPWPVVLDYLFPTDDPQAPDWIAPGDLLSISKFPNGAMVLHVAKLDADDTPLVCLTVVPVAFGKFQAGNNRQFRLKAPTALNPGGPLPVFPAAAAE